MALRDRLEANDEFEQLRLVAHNRANRPAGAEPHGILDDEEHQTEQLDALQRIAPLRRLHFTVRHRAEDEAQRGGDDRQEDQVGDDLREIRRIWMLERQVYALEQREPDRQLLLPINTEELRPRNTTVLVAVVRPGVEAVVVIEGEEQPLHRDLEGLKRDLVVVANRLSGDADLPAQELAEDGPEEQELDRLLGSDEPCLPLRPHLRRQHAHPRVVLHTRGARDQEAALLRRVMLRAPGRAR
mmetsp:Transcript_113750/g.317709  ORF Transcript_113750/g.317709 Transcript_113750/m.317709 type:complete len:242 (+) Transcript_113750:1727-2452(+)